MTFLLGTECDDRVRLLPLGKKRLNSSRKICSCIMMQMHKCGGRLIKNVSEQPNNSSVYQQLQSLLTVLVGIVQTPGILVVSSAKRTVESGGRPSEKSFNESSKEGGTEHRSLWNTRHRNILSYDWRGSLSRDTNCLPNHWRYYPYPACCTEILPCYMLIQCKMCEQGCLAQGHFESGEPHFAPFTLYKWGKPLCAFTWALQSGLDSLNIHVHSGTVHRHLHIQMHTWAHMHTPSESSSWQNANSKC